MQITRAWIPLKSVTFVTSTFPRAETFDFKVLSVKSKTYKVVSNLLYDESYHLLESSSLTDKFGLL